MSNYFGTDTRSAGHYLWTLEGEFQSGNSLSGFKELPFDPEQCTRVGKYGWIEKGEIEYKQVGGYSVLAICGSPIDKRQGCKSVFFWKEDLTLQQMIDKIKSIPAAMKIINQMPFHVEYFKEQPHEQ